MPLGDETWLKLTDKNLPSVPEQREKPDLEGLGQKNSESLSLGSTLSPSPGTYRCRLAGDLSEELHSLSILGHTGSPSHQGPTAFIINPQTIVTVEEKVKTYGIFMRQSSTHN